MDRNKFLTLISDPVDVSENDITFFSGIVEKYPYFQIGHLFVAKLMYDKGGPGKTEKLNRAALYTVNRGVLKRIIESSWDQLPKYKPEMEAVGDKDQETKEEETDHRSEAAIPEQESAERAEAYEAPVEEGDNSQKEPTADESSDDTAEETLSLGIEDTGESAHPDTHKPSTEQSAGSSKDLAKEVMANLEEAKKLREKIESLNPDDIAESEIQEIQVPAPEAVDPIGPEDLLSQVADAEKTEEDDSGSGEGEPSKRKQEQLQIIDNFINNEYLFANRRYKYKQDSPQEIQEDLSIKSSSLGDDLVSENLASIMEKQNKIDKAIDIYKKLIWKFPQKKAYFASLIEELKNR